MVYFARSDGLGWVVVFFLFFSQSGVRCPLCQQQRLLCRASTRAYTWCLGLLAFLIVVTELLHLPSSFFLESQAGQRRQVLDLFDTMLAQGIEVSIKAEVHIWSYGPTVQQVAASR